MAGQYRVLTVAPGVLEQTLNAEAEAGWEVVTMCPARLLYSLGAEYRTTEIHVTVRQVLARRPGAPVAPALSGSGGPLP